MFFKKLFSEIPGFIPFSQNQPLITSDNIPLLSQWNKPLKKHCIIIAKLLFFLIHSYLSSINHRFVSKAYKSIALIISLLLIFKPGKKIKRKYPPSFLYELSCLICAFIAGTACCSFCLHKIIFFYISPQR